MTKSEWIAKWSKCKACPLHLNARHHVLYRGAIPAEVLLIGEAPGRTEDKLGKPFIGPAGEILTAALQRLSVASYCITNVVCCLPFKNTDSIKPPSPQQAEACSPHIRELVSLCNPKLVALLGKEAEKSFDQTLVPEGAGLTMLRHPSYIRRRGGVNSVEFKRFLHDFEAALQSAGVTHFNCFNAVV